MAQSKWTPSIGAVRVTPVTEYSVPGVNTTRRIVYRPPLAVWPSLRVHSVFCFERSLWHCGQLWPYVRMWLLGTCLQWNCNAMGDTAKIPLHILSICTQNAMLSLPNIHIIPSCQTYVAIDNPSLVPFVFCVTTWSYLWNYVCAANNVSHADDWQSNGCRCVSHL
jgi:hypothetical protein